MNNHENPQTFFEPWRLYVFFGLMVLIFGFYATRLFTIQVIQGPARLAEAEENRTTIIRTQTQRGIIYDRNGYVLARNIASYNVTITPAYLPTDEGATQQIYRELSELIDIPVNRGEITDDSVKAFSPCDNDFGITQVVYIGDTNAPYDPVRIKCNIDQTTALIVEEKGNDWPGIGIEIEPVRDYPTGWLTSEIIGFLGPIPASQEPEYIDEGFVPGRDKVGYSGIEYQLQDVLSGTNGTRTVEVDIAGQELRDLEPPVEPVPGNNVRLTIDTRLQTAAKNALIGEMEGWNEYLNEQRYTNGVAIAMNPKTGEILALVSYPTYENNRMARIIPAYYYEQLTEDPNRPLFNHAVSAEHPPGSVFKLAAALGILNEGVVTPEYQVEDPGKITINQKYLENDAGTPRDYVCYLYKDTGGGHGLVDFLHGVAWSCDVYFYKVGGGFEDEVPEGLGIWRLGEYARAIGYGSPLGIELPGEEGGLIPDPTWKRINVGENWSTGDTYIATIGQGYVLATPLQVLESAATVANDGKLMRPTLVKDILDSEGNVIKSFEPDLVHDITVDPVINVYDEDSYQTGEKKTVAPWVIDMLQEGMHMVTLEGGTGESAFAGMEIPSAGKTGTAEYCDNVAQAKNLCQPGAWPAHAWYIGYAPFDDPEIAVVAFVYNGSEGATLAAPVVRKIMDAYFELKAIDAAKSGAQ
ncbi:MAG: penicillin-binding protein 2 [Chloroflexi bacterium]|nr:penicillin-binding protein 2 [Chloroflexota bacterium]